jgi:hypothetical protein
MTVERRQVKLAKNAEDMERWLRKLIRAANEVDRLRRERKRLLKPREFKEQPEIAAGLNDELPPTIKSGPRSAFPPSGEWPALERERAKLSEQAKALAEATKAKNDDLEIPDYLKRAVATGRYDAKHISDTAKRLATLPDPKTKEKKAERRAIDKEKRDADLRGKTRKMPLSGKAALDAIRSSE